MEERRQQVRRDSDQIELEVELIKRDIQSLKDLIERNEDQLNSLTESIERLQHRLEQHYSTEHKEIKELLSWFKGSSMAFKFIGFLIAITAGIASAWAWVTGHFTITPK